MGTKITRKAQKIFCGNVSASTNIAQFGSLKAADPNYSDDPDVIQALDAWVQGWKSAIVNGQAPPLQDMNAIQYLVTRQLAYLMQSGIAEWNAATEYFIGSYATNSFGKKYVSKVDNNLNHALTDTNYWTLFEPGSVPIGAIVATFPNLTGAYSCVAASAADFQGYVICDGQVLNDATSPMNGVTIPNLSDDRFIMGDISGSAGGTGGANSLNLAHTHSMKHVHQWGFVYYDGGNRAFYTCPDLQTYYVTINQNYKPLWKNGLAYASGSGGAIQYFSGVNADFNCYTTGVISAPSGQGDAAVTDSKLGASQDIRPKYISARYVMRVK